MQEPIRVLLVEHRHEDRRIAHQLLTDYGLDFTRRSVASQGELHALADDFGPDIVLCADDSSNSSHSLLGALRLLCSHTPVILISSVREADGSIVCDAAALLRSLSYLSRLPVDRLKLDRLLIRMMTLSSKGAAVMRSMISLGADLDIDVLAEGVETEHQLQMLVQLGCPRVQGYPLGRPMSATQAQVVLRKAWGNRPAPDLHPMSLARTDRYHGHPAEPPKVRK